MILGMLQKKMLYYKWALQGYCLQCSEHVNILQSFKQTFEPVMWFGVFYKLS